MLNLKFYAFLFMLSGRPAYLLTRSIDGFQNLIICTTATGNEKSDLLGYINKFRLYGKNEYSQKKPATCMLEEERLAKLI